MFPVIIHTDGACSGNPGPGGWGAVTLTPDGLVVEMGAGEGDTTNNRMELTAAIVALRAVRRYLDVPVDLHTDSTYMIEGITKWVHGWKKRHWINAEGKPVANRDLWEALDRQVAARSGHGEITWHYVRGHRGNPGNERCDAIATGFARGGHPALFRGSLLGYSIDLLERPADTSVPARRDRSGDPRSKSAGGGGSGAVSYLSLVGAKVERHETWEQCQGRVNGVSGARFKKCRSSEEERQVLRTWGLQEDALGSSAGG